MSAPPQRELLLLLVAFHPCTSEIQSLQDCLRILPSTIGYCLVINDYQSGEPVENLFAGADCVVCNLDNPGYGRAVNQLVQSLPSLPKYLGVLNTDLVWESGTFETLLAWLTDHHDVVLGVPQILDPAGQPQQLCKRHPTLLALCSRRFVPERFKPSWLRRYDQWFVMADNSLDQVFDVPYLSGCCMVMRAEAFLNVGGFDQRFFLYLEDADLTRSLSSIGRCVHLPVSSVVHGWGRGNYSSVRLMLVNIFSAWLYFRKWGLRLW